MKNKRGIDKVNVGQQERSNPRTQRTDLVESERNEAVCRSWRAWDKKRTGEEVAWKTWKKRKNGKAWRGWVKDLEESWTRAVCFCGYQILPLRSFSFLLWDALRSCKKCFRVVSRIVQKFFFLSLKLSGIVVVSSMAPRSTNLNSEAKQNMR